MKLMAAPHGQQYHQGRYIRYKQEKYLSLECMQGQKRNAQRGLKQQEIDWYLWDASFF